MTTEYRPPEGQVDVLVVGPYRLNVQRARTANPDDFNHLVGDGSISMCPLPPSMRDRGYYAYCDDDAHYRKQPLNKWRTHLGRYILRGPIVIFRSDGMGNEVSLKPSEVRELVQYFAGEPSDEALECARQDAAWWNEHPKGVAVVEVTSLDELFPPESR